MNKKKIALVSLFIALIALFLSFDIAQYLDLAYVKSQQEAINHYYAQSPVRTGLIFFISYILITGISLPGAGILTLAAGAIFGIVWGTILVSFGSMFGATMAFLIARYLFHDYVQTKFKKYLEPINHGIRKEGDLYLFTIRFVPIFPFFIINNLMALTPIKTLNFALVSQIGMLIPTIIFVNAGTQLAKIESIGDVLSPELIFSFALLGIFPLVAKKILVYIRKKRHESLDDFIDPENDVE
ncbi:MAG: TVP38/TMEM64 family protein [Gammaproteobacteria bacterium]|jgi:uncharacterized membrane protein YdjX (TVP38/TMEM64 family)